VGRNDISATTASNHATLVAAEEVEDRWVDVTAEEAEDVVGGVAHLVVADDSYNTIGANAADMTELEEIRRFKL
jgi:hypothetical protein